jgi:hypothetical protein
MLTRAIAAALLASAALPGADFTVRTVDGLERPLADVSIRISCFSKGREVLSIELKSDGDGVARGSYDSAVCKAPWLSLGKPGYESYSTSGLRERDVLRRQFPEQEAERIARLGSDRRLAELREFLGGDNAFPKTVFYHEARLRPALLSLTKDPAVTRVARELLALIGVPEDLSAIVRLPAPPEVLGFPERWRYKVAAALTSPGNEADWDFLRRCALGEFKDSWVSTGAIQSLRLIATPQSRRILGEAFPVNVQAQTQIAKAIKYISSDPVALEGDDLEALARGVAPALNVGTWKKNGSPLYNEARDKALVSMEFQTGPDALTYEATFHRTDRGWVFRGAFESQQSLSAPEPSEMKHN